MASEAVQVEAETVSFIRSLHAFGLLIIQAGKDKTQHEYALRSIIEACDSELERLGIDDSSHNKLPNSR